MTNGQEVSSGVQSLISRLRDEGVEAGEKKAEDLIKKADAAMYAAKQQGRNKAVKFTSAVKLIRDEENQTE